MVTVTGIMHSHVSSLTSSVVDPDPVMFLGLPDPDPSLFCTDSDRNPFTN